MNIGLNYKVYKRMKLRLAEVKIVEKWVCIVCGYIYDPDAGDPGAGIDPGTPFEDLPDDWVCPVCFAPKDQFEKM